ncbi:MAG: hypothetical protein JW922_08890 [Paludibacteraceae bacterium]|nr:hypothetical protein [Paludibacteraceae bacterium]
MAVAEMYISAAKRHKYVCSELFERLKNDISEDNQKRILHNIYYLTGYIIECSCCAAIYSHYPKIQHKRNLDTTSLTRDRKPRNVAFKSISPSVFSVVGDEEQGNDHHLKTLFKISNIFRQTRYSVTRWKFRLF